jgi:hypothetical protein
MRRKTSKTLIAIGLLFAILITASFCQAAKNQTVLADTTTSTTSSDSVPLYAFNGAFVTYALNDYHDRRVTFTISEVNAIAQTFKVSATYTGSWNVTNKGSSETISYVTISPIPNEESPLPFSAASYADLQLLNKGEFPPDMPAGVVVTSNVSIFALGGYYFNTDWVQLPSAINGTNDFSAYVDTRSGLAVAEDFGANGAAWGIAYGQLSLITTNIPMTAEVRITSPSPPPTSPLVTDAVVLGAVAAAVVVAAVLLVYFKKRKPHA